MIGFKKLSWTWMLQRNQSSSFLCLCLFLLNVQNLINPYFSLSVCLWLSVSLCLRLSLSLSVSLSLTCQRVYCRTRRWARPCCRCRWGTLACAGFPGPFGGMGGSKKSKIEKSEIGCRLSKWLGNACRRFEALQHFPLGFTARMSAP